ncbi:MAG: tetratricopeptide repeat protein [Bacteroidia bacterium]|nr:tetratricopeptide repeat protein [Bacteroidia bacterium]
MLKNTYILLFSLLILLGKAQYFDTETYLAQNVNASSYSSSAGLNKIIQDIKKSDNNSIIRALEELNTDSLSGSDKAKFYLLKSAYYSKTRNFKSALENSLLALRLSQKSNFSYLSELALLMQSTIYYKLNASKNITALSLNSVDNPEISFQLNYLLAQSYLKLNEYESGKTTCQRIFESHTLSKYDHIQTLKVQAALLGKLQEYKVALQTMYRIDSLLDNIKTQPFTAVSNSKLVYVGLNNQSFDKKILNEQFVSKNNIGFLLIKIKEADKAETFFNSALKVARAGGHRQSELEAEKNIGLCNTLSKRFSKAEDHYLIAEKIGATLNNPNQQSELLCIRAKNYYLLNNLSRARELCNTSVDLAQANNNYNQLSQSYSVLAEINAFVGDIQKAAHYSELAKENMEKASRESAKYDNEDRANVLKDEVANDVFSKEKAELELIQLKLEATKRYQELEIIKREN